MLINPKFTDPAAEAAFLGSLVIDPSIIEAARSTLAPDDLHRHEHRIIYDAIGDTWTAHGAMDLVLLRDTLVSIGKLDAVGGVAYLVQIAEAVPSAASWEHYARSVHEKAVLRRQFLAHNKAIAALQEPGLVSDRLDAAAHAMAEIPAHGNGHAKIVMESMDTIEPAQIDWLWTNRIPAGMVSLIVGLPGQGKSFISLDMAAKISRGIPWPDGHPCKKGKVLLFALEEDPAVSTRPRLDACGADCSKILLFKGIRHHGVDRDTIDVHEHLPTLEKSIKDHADLRMVVFDPITSVMGGADQNSQAEVRDALTLLAQFAKRTGVAVVGISHFAKRTDTAAVYKTLGSVSFAAVARSVWCVHRDPISEENPCPPRLFLPVKANYSVEAQGLSFEIVNGGVEWSTTTITRTIDEAIKPDKRRHIGEWRQAARDWLKSALDDGQEHKVTGLQQEYEGAGFNRDIIWKASQDIGVKKRNSKVEKCWVWSLPTDGDQL